MPSKELMYALHDSIDEKTHNPSFEKKNISDISELHMNKSLEKQVKNTR